MEEKQQFVSWAGSGHFTVRELGWQLGVSRKTGHKWLACHAQDGMKAQPGNEVGDLPDDLRGRTVDPHRKVAPFDLESKELWLVFRRYGGETGRSAWIRFQR